MQQRNQILVSTTGSFGTSPKSGIELSKKKKLSQVLLKWELNIDTSLGNMKIVGHLTKSH